MTTLTIDVADLDSVKDSMKAAFRGEPQGCSYSFRSEERLLSILTANRWAILKALTGAGPLGVRELARRVGRDVKGVHTDTQLLANCGLIDKTEDGKLHLPYDEVRVQLVAKAAA
ncbi:transcriptional regulator [Thiorhodococcus minor]|uniref:Transcriptional regulator n=1 Tax=Thiorhodococcus minor TaxID=57489 RepID=A0A6M0JWI5_9GAMM|nr:transcriptional regulator [Thiorhodococcus minor]NEV60667.1 transcriptional regulator [Thiorhodococcus minor]